MRSSNHHLLKTGSNILILSLFQRDEIGLEIGHIIGHIHTGALLSPMSLFAELELFNVLE